MRTTRQTMRKINRAPSADVVSAMCLKLVELLVELLVGSGAKLEEFVEGKGTLSLFCLYKA